MMKDLAVISVLYDYPEHFVPTFEKRLLEDFPKEDYFVLRFNSVSEGIKEESYYFKFTYYRVNKIYEIIKNKILDKYKYFILLDATDVGYVGNLSKILTIMENYDTKVLFGAERNLWPNTEYSHLYSSKNISTPYKFLNAGVFCAEPETYLNHLDNIKKRGLVGLCDQGNWQIEYLTEDGVEIDYRNELVLNTFEAKEDFSVENGVVNFKTQRPIFVHDNGGYNEKTIKLLEFFR